VNILSKIIKFFQTLTAPLKNQPIEKWLLVRTYVVDVTVTRSPETDRVGETGFAYAYMFESESGKRRVEFGCSLSGFDAETSFKKLRDWAEHVYPWVNGRYLANTPTYSEAESLDVAARLKDCS